MGIFNLNNPVMQGINKIIQTIYLGMLWFLCSIPLITVGASTAALYEVLLKLTKDQEGNITKSFFQAFKSDLKQGICVWLVNVLTVFLLGVNVYYYGVVKNGEHAVLATAFLILLLIAVAVFAYLYPAMAKTENTLSGHFQIAVILMLRNPGWSVLLVLLQLLTLFLIWFFIYAPILFLMGPMGYLQALVFNHIFDGLMARGMITEERPSQERLL